MIREVRRYGWYRRYEVPKEEVKRMIEPIKETVVKAGVKTSEFWFAVVTAVAGLVGQLAEVVSEPWGGILAAISVTVYTLSRTLLKKESNGKPTSPNIN